MKKMDREEGQQIINNPIRFYENLIYHQWRLGEGEGSILSTIRYDSKKIRFSQHFSE